MKPEQFIDTARRLIDWKPEGKSGKTVTEEAHEGDQRSAISRSYYAAFHAALESLPRAFAPSRESLDGGASHRAVTDALDNWARSVAPGRREARSVSARLKNLKHARKHADYLIDLPVDPSNVRECVDRATTLLRVVRLARKKHDGASKSARKDT